MFVRFITAGEPEYTTVDATEGEKSFGRTWILLCPETNKVLVLFVKFPADALGPPLGAVYQIIKLARKPGPTIEGLIGRDRHDGGWYRILPCPEMNETRGGT